jgi:cation:H+ antiporter
VSTPIALAFFALSLLATLYAAWIFADRLDRLGTRLGLPEALLGLLTAAGADAPELSSAIVAIARGDHEVGFGVVVGSNLFNIATMIGLSALVAGGVRLRRESLALEGSVAGAVALLAFLLAVGAIPAWAAAALVALVVVPYVVAIAAGTHRLRSLPLAPRVRRALEAALGDAHGHEHPHGHQLWLPLLVIPPALAAIVLGSIGMVHSALLLGDRWGVPRVVVGTLVLAGLTSIPNAYTGIRLGRRGRGAALVSETMNSNTINLVGGVVVPALVIGAVSLSSLEVTDFAWLLVTTAVAIALLWPRRGAGRAAGILLLVSYAVFVVVQATHP